MNQCKKIISVSLCIILILCPLAVFAEDDAPWNPIVIDGYFDDWQDKPSSLEMKDNNQNTPNDSLHRNTISLFRDGENVYLYVQVADLYGEGIPGSGRGFQFWCDGRKVSFQISPLDDIYLPEEIPEEILPEEIPEEILLEEQPEEILPEEQPDEILPEEIPEEILPEEQPDETIPDQIPEDIQQEEPLPDDIQQPEQLTEDSQQHYETYDESRLMEGPLEEMQLLEESSDTQSVEDSGEGELLDPAYNKKPLKLNELPEGSYPLKVEYEAGKYEANGTEAYLTCNEDRTGDQIEIKIPYTAFSDADKRIDSDDIKTIEFQNSHLTHRKIICTGTDTAPYLGIVLAVVVGSAGGYFLWKRKER